MHAEIPYSEAAETREVRNCTEAVETQFETVYRNSCSITYSKECRCSAVPSAVPSTKCRLEHRVETVVQEEEQCEPCSYNTSTTQQLQTRGHCSLQYKTLCSQTLKLQHRGRAGTIYMSRCMILTLFHSWLFRALRAEE